MIIKSVQGKSDMLPADVIEYAIKCQQRAIAEELLSKLTPYEEHIVRFIKYNYARPQTNELITRMEIKIDPVVRCFDCKWFSPVIPTRCTRSYGMPVSSEDFCSFGEKEDSNEDRR